MLENHNGMTYIIGLNAKLSLIKGRSILNIDFLSGLHPKNTCCYKCLSSKRQSLLQTVTPFAVPAQYPAALHCSPPQLEVCDSAGL